MRFFPTEKNGGPDHECKSVCSGPVLSCGVLVGAAKGLKTVIVDTGPGVTCFEVEIAETHWRRARGLMHRDGLREDEGMLFIYEQEQPVTFWMKNVAFPLDLLFIASSGRIVHIVEEAEPESTTPIASGVAVNAVLELRGGASKRSQINPGDEVLYLGAVSRRAVCP